MLAAATPLCAQEILKNSDFSDGATYWHGDAKTVGSEGSTDFTSDAGGTAKGIVVEIHSGGWTKVTQEIRGYKGTGHASGMLLTIVYQTSQDFKLSTRTEDYANVGASVGFEGANLMMQPGQVAAFVDEVPVNRLSESTSGGYNNYTVYSDHISGAKFVPSTEAKPQTFTSQISIPAGNPDEYPTFCLAFPPGGGTITILKISIAPPSDSTGSSAQTP